MQRALTILGFPCYHYMSVIGNTKDAEVWIEALDAKFLGKGSPFTLENWDQLLGNHAAVADLPAIAFAEDLICCYPDAKVILVERDIEDWYRSFNDAVILNVWSPFNRFVARIDPYFVGRLKRLSDHWTEGWMGVHSRVEMQAIAREKYREHYALVERVTPPKRLLKLKLGHGWEPLCQFLGLPVPDVNFPRINDSRALDEKVGLIMRKGLKNTFFSTLKFFGPLMILVCAWFLLNI